MEFLLLVIRRHDVRVRIDGHFPKNHFIKKIQERSSWRGLQQEDEYGNAEQILSFHIASVQDALVRCSSTCDAKKLACINLALNLACIRFIAIEFIRSSRKKSAYIVRASRIIVITITPIRSLQIITIIVIRLSDSVIIVIRRGHSCRSLKKK